MVTDLELGSEAVNVEGSHHERLEVSEVQGPLHPKGGERELEESTFVHGVWNGFSKVLVLQVMTRFIVDLCRRA